MKRLFPVVIFIIFLLPVSLFSQVTNPVVFTADETDSLLEAEFEFSPLPEYGRPTTLNIKLKALSPRLMERAVGKSGKAQIHPGIQLKGSWPRKFNTDNVLYLDLIVGPSRYTNFNDTTLSWKTPISQGDSMMLSLPVKLDAVGTFSAVVSEASHPKDILYLKVDIVIGDDGKLVYLGKSPAPFKNPLGAHPYVFGKKIEDRLPGKKSEVRLFGTTMSEPFDIELSINPSLRIGQTSTANLSIEALTDALEQLQYELIAATNLQIDSLSPSPGLNPGAGGRFDVSFNITPQKIGRSFLAFEIFGYKPGAKHSDIISSFMRYYLVFGSDSTLLYMGAVDPFNAGLEADNPAYAKIADIMDFADTGYGEKVYRSQPDFEYDRIHEQWIQDSLKAAALRDTLEAKDSTK